ncbi:hypothetical protein BGX21_005993, partial [Mortierella sp. AD011]
MTFNFNQAQGSIVDADLRSVLDAMDNVGLNLWSSIFKLFSSQDRYVQEKTNSFYIRKGPAKLVNLWLGIFGKGRRRKDLIDVAMKAIIEDLDDGLCRLSHHNALKAPADSVNLEKIGMFELHFIVQKYQDNAPQFYSLLHGIASMKDKTHKKQITFMATISSMGCHGSGYSSSELRPFLLAYDNINIADIKADQPSINKGKFYSGATGTVIMGERLGSQDLTEDPVVLLCYTDLMPSLSSEQHMDNVSRFHLVDVLKRHSESYHDCSNPIPEKKPLQVKKTEAYPLPSMLIDQSSVEGNKEILETILRLLKLGMLLGGTIHHTHYGTTKSVGSLSFVVELLDRKRINVDKLNFHAIDELIRETFEAMVIRVWEEVLGEKKDQFDKTCEGLDQAAKDNLVNSRVHLILERYLSSSARENLNGNLTRNAALFIRDALYYIELSAAIKIGDISRIEEMLKWITIAFQAWTTKNYAQELLHLHCGLRYAWTEET